MFAPDSRSPRPNARAHAYGRKSSWEVSIDGVVLGTLARTRYLRVDEPTFGGVDIELKFTAGTGAAATAKIGEFDQLRWIQVIYTNESFNDGKVRRYVDPENPDEPPGQDPRPFYWTNQEEKDHRSGNDTTFSDRPSRGKSEADPSKPKIWWQAELALVGVKTSGEIRVLEVVKYGFDIDYQADGTRFPKLAVLRGTDGPSAEWKAAVEAFIATHGGGPLALALALALRRAVVWSGDPRKPSFSIVRAQSVGAPPIVVLDPGHGGSVKSGSSTPLGVQVEGLSERDLTLGFAERLRVAIGSGVTVQLTRASLDENPSLATRIAFAKENGARVFVSLHGNGGPASTSGGEVWVHEGASAQSAQLAQAISAQVARSDTRHRGVFQGPLAVLDATRHAPDTAAVLVELDYLTSPDGRARLKDEAHLTSLARGLADGIIEHALGSHPPTNGLSRGLDAGEAAEIAWEKANPQGFVEDGTDPDSWVLWNFAVGSGAAKAEHDRFLRALATWFNDNASITTVVSVEGHSSSSGDAKRNQAISEARARSVAGILKAAGIRAQVDSVGLGATDPRVANDTPEHMAMNRRVVIRWAEMA